MRIVMRMAGEKTPACTILGVCYVEPLPHRIQFTTDSGDCVSDVQTITIAHSDFHYDGEVYDFLEVFND